MVSKKNIKCIEKPFINKRIMDNNTNLLRSFAELMQGANNAPQYNQLLCALNSINSYDSQRIAARTIDNGLDSCKNIMHAFISANSTYSEKRKEIEKAACTAYYDTLKAGHKDLFRYHSLLLE